MADIIGIENMNEDELRREIANGGRFVQYIWCISLLLITFKRPSDIYFIRAGESATKKGLSYTFLTLLLGWWGVPWGPIYSLQCLGKNLSGGYDLTDHFLANLQTQDELEEVVEQSAITPDLDDAAVQAEPKPESLTKAPVMRNRGGPVVRR